VPEPNFTQALGSMRPESGMICYAASNNVRSALQGGEMIDDGAEPIRCAPKAIEKRHVVAGFGVAGFGSTSSFRALFVRQTATTKIICSR